MGEVRVRREVGKGRAGLAERRGPGPAGGARRPGFPSRSLAASSVLTALQSEQTAGEGAVSGQIGERPRSGPPASSPESLGSRGLETRVPESDTELPSGTE